MKQSFIDRIIAAAFIASLLTTLLIGERVFADGGQTSEYMGLGVPDSVATRTGETWAGALTAAGNSSQANAYAIINSSNIFTTVTAASADSARLPTKTAIPRDAITITNNGAGVLQVYPQVGGAINNIATNSPFPLASGSSARFQRTSATAWSGIANGTGGSATASSIPAADNTYDLGTALLQWRSLYLGTNVILGAASAKIIAGATSLLFRNNADSQSNLIITDAGVVTARAGLVATAGDIVSSTSGGTLSIQEATAGAACSGTLTANGATPVVTSTTCALTGARIFLQRTSAETGVVTAWISAISNATSFSITGEAGDTGTYNWFIIHES